MKLPLVRFTVRRMMVVVAAIAVIFGGELSRRAHARYRLMASEHDAKEQFLRILLSGRNGAPWLKGEDGRGYPMRDLDYWRYRTDVGVMRDGTLGFTVNESEPIPGPEILRKRADFHSQMRAKYLGASRYPWLPVEPDPPEPK